MASESSVEQKILECVDEGLQVLGETGKKAIYRCLESNFNVAREEIPRNPETFCKGLNTMLGEEGASIIRKWIINKLGVTFHLKFPFQTTFTKAVNEITRDVITHSDSI
ncbi:MAG: hypothetical protein PVH12_02045 [Candidatus Bathyarchaeota archaeon]|jgi:hypothetical protein